MRIFAKNKKTGDEFEITDLYWFEENGVHDFSSNGTYEKFEFRFLLKAEDMNKVFKGDFHILYNDTIAEGDA